eukprot:g91.t1
MFVLYPSTKRLISTTILTPPRTQWTPSIPTLPKLLKPNRPHIRPMSQRLEASISRVKETEMLADEVECGGTRSFVFACDDSIESEAGARYLMERLVRVGDTVHFVHVISDNRSSFVSLGEVSCDTEDVFSFSSMDTNDTFSLMERQKCLEECGERMMKRRFGKTINNRSSVETRVHLPILSRPESAAEIASVVCNLATDLTVDALVIVSPSSGVFLSYGSVGYHCCEQSTVPVVLLPVMEMPSRPLEGNNMILLLAKTEAERTKAVQWTKAHIAHVFEPFKFYVACIEQICSCKIPDTTKIVTKKLEKDSETLDPACAVLYFNSEMSILEQLKMVPLVESYYEENRFPIVLLPRLHPSNHFPGGYWSDFAYTSQEILQV